MGIIVTGFEPFGGAKVNASWEAVRELTGVEKALLPVSFERAAEAVRKIVSARPSAVICVGEAGGRDGISAERVAVNLMDARIPDNDGAQPADAPIRPEGPAAYFSTLPTRAIAEGIRAAGIAGALSYTAGTYVCNCVFYTLMDEIARLSAPTLGGFIHVPARGMETDRLTAALRIAVNCTEAALKQG